jgi:hypothetical protein
MNQQHLHQHQHQHQHQQQVLLLQRAQQQQQVLRIWSCSYTNCTTTLHYFTAQITAQIKLCTKIVVRNLAFTRSYCVVN